MSKIFDENGSAENGSDCIRLVRPSGKKKGQVFHGILFFDNSNAFVRVHLYRRSVARSTEKDSEERKREIASVMSRLDSLIGELGLLCLYMFVLGQTVLSRAKFSESFR